MRLNDRDVIQGARGTTPPAPTAFLASIRGNPQGSMMGVMLLVTFRERKVTRAPRKKITRIQPVLRE